MSKLNFVPQTARKRPIKPISDKFKESRLRPNIEVSDGFRPHFPMVPLRYLDVKFQDISTEQWVVIPKGRIISAITVQNPVSGDPLKVGAKVPVVSETIHEVTAGEGTDTSFNLNLDQFPVVAGTVSITDEGTETFTDDGEGTLTGSAGGSGTIDYNTGAISITFNAAPGEGATISGTYQYVPDDTQYLGVVDQTDGTTPLYLGADDSYYGITRDIAGIMVPCNGGASRTITYTANDVLAAVPDASGAAATVSAGDTYVLPANAPIGVAMMDIYQDIRGAHLNYELWKSYGLLAEQVIVLPFVDFGILGQLASDVKFVEVASGTQSGYKIGASGAALDATEDAGYAAAEKKYSFLYFDSIAAPTAGLSGQLLGSDVFGNWVPAGAAYDNANSISLAAAKTAQTVGRLLYVDTRFPKDLLETVDTMYGQRLAGTGTDGLPESLFDFINTVLVAGGYTFSTVDAAKVAKELVQNGAFGLAYIQLSAR